MSHHKVRVIIQELPNRGLELKENAILGPRGKPGEKGEPGRVGPAPTTLDGGNF